jgi:hypothetical protein
MHSRITQKLRRVLQTQTVGGGKQDHLLLRRAVDPAPWSPNKGELDEHFGFPVVERIEQANDYFRTKLIGLLDAA